MGLLLYNGIVLHYSGLIIARREVPRALGRDNNLENVTDKSTPAVLCYSQPGDKSRWTCFYSSNRPTTRTLSKGWGLVMKILRRRTTYVTGMLVVIAGCFSTAHADTIGINFNNGGATLLDPTDVVGVVPSANWNNFRNNGGLGLSNPTPTVLNDATGADSGARVTWDVGASFFNSNNGTGNQRMMEGWFGLNAGDNGQIVVDGLPAAYTSSGYDAYVYFDSDAIAPNERTMTFTAAGTSISGKE